MIVFPIHVHSIDVDSAQQICVAGPYSPSPASSRTADAAPPQQLLPKGLEQFTDSNCWFTESCSIQHKQISPPFVLQGRNVSSQ
jgi:hypothetical protein